MKYVLDVHTHTIASGHAYNTIKEMAQSASEKGLELLGITEHAMKMPGTCHSFYFANLKMLERKMFGVEMLFGVELNILNQDGEVDMEENLLKKMDIVIASMHIPCFKSGTKEENRRNCWYTVYYKCHVRIPVNFCCAADRRAQLFPGAGAWPAC